MARILHLIAADHRRGAETFAVELAEVHRRSGHHVDVLAVAPAGVPQPLPVNVAGRSRTDPRGLARVLAAARRSDVVVSFGSSSLLVGAAAARLVRRPFVYRTIGDPSVWGKVRYSDLRIGTPARSARRVVALYPAAARTLEANYRLDPDALTVIPRGVPADRYRPATASDRSDAQRELGLDPRTRWLAYVGALSEEKDPLLALDALELLDEGIGLLIAGDGPLRDLVAARSATMGSRVRLLGAVGDVRPVYAACDALVLPSRTEGIPGAAVEASLSERPVVAFDVGGVSSVVVDRVTGRVVQERSARELAAAIGEVLAHLEEYGEAALQHCQDEFSMDVVGRAWSELITQVTGS